MRRWRFWLAQFIWLIAAAVSGIAGAEGDAEIIPFVVFMSFIFTGFLLQWGAKGKNEAERNVMGYDGHVIARIMATGLIWISYLAGSVTAVLEMAGWGVLLALILMIPATAFTALLWTWERISGVADQRMQMMSEQAEKRKRSRIDSVLSDLSDEDLMRLRDRLADSRLDEAERYDGVVGDDGELVYRH